jgi:hypothetical protein
MICKRSLRQLALTLCCCMALGMGVAPAQQLDGPKYPVNDALLDNLVGDWSMTGTVAHRQAHDTVHADWVLNHQFLRIHEKNEVIVTSDSPGYEAIVMVGYDHASDRYVVHWMDIYGGRFSETLGYGTRNGNDIALTFEYPDGPFHTTFRWKPVSKSWQWLMEQKNKEGKWTQFADLTLAPADKK